MATMLASNLSVIDGDMNSPEWIVRNIVIDMAGYWLGDIADLAEIDDSAMTYTIHTLNEPDELGFLYCDLTKVLTFQQIWNSVQILARSRNTLRPDIVNAIRHAAFDKDGDEVDAEVAYCIIQHALFGCIPFG